MENHCLVCGLQQEHHHMLPDDCYKASRALAKKLREFLAGVSPFISCWELDPYDMTRDGEEAFKAIADMVGFERK